MTGVATYNILGKQVGSHWLAMATLGITFGGSWAATRGGGSKGDKTQSPPVNASSKEEEQFINEFIAQAEAEEKKAKA